MGKKLFADMNKGAEMLQSLDGTLSKKKEKVMTPEEKQVLAFKHITCHQAVDNAENSWERVASGLNSVQFRTWSSEFKVTDADATHCDKNWVLEGATMFWKSQSQGPPPTDAEPA